MLKIFNFLKKETGEVKMLTMRERFDAAQSEMNAVLAELGDMPVIRIDASARQIEITAPEQFADEALALPAPTPEEDTPAKDASMKDTSSEDAQSEDAPKSDDESESAKTAA